MASTLRLTDIPSDENTVSISNLQLRTFQSGDAEAFRLLNEEWISKYFKLEEHDREMLGDPEGYILAQGGHVFFAVADGTAIGCCALIPLSGGVFEVAKMAVSEQWRGRGIGRRILAYTIEQARALGAPSLYLETSTQLKNAIHLYESLGFRHVPPRPSPYVRATVFMELVF